MFLTISLIKVNTKLHNEIHFISLKNAEMTELLNAETTKAAELTNKHEDSEYELSKVKIKTINDDIYIFHEIVFRIDMVLNGQFLSL